MDPVQWQLSSKCVEPRVTTATLLSWPERNKACAVIFLSENPVKLNVTNFCWPVGGRRFHCSHFLESSSGFARVRYVNLIHQVRSVILDSALAKKPDL